MGLGDSIKNSAKETVGKVKETVGDATDNHSLEFEGKKEQAEAKVGQATHEASDKADDALDDAKHKADDAWDAAKDKADDIRDDLDRKI